MKPRLATGLAAALLLAACAPPAPPVDTEEVPPPPAPALAEDEPAAALEPVELPVGSGNQPLVLAAGASQDGQLQAPRAGRVGALGIHLGTYFDTSDGELDLRLCRAQDCASGSADLALAEDNGMFRISLEPALEVAAGDTLAYSLAKRGGAVAVVVWTYPPAAAPDGPRVPRLELYYQR